MTHNLLVTCTALCLMQAGSVFPDTVQVLVKAMRMPEVGTCIYMYTCICSVYCLEVELGSFSGQSSSVYQVETLALHLLISAT